MEKADNPSATFVNEPLYRGIIDAEYAFLAIAFFVNGIVFQLSGATGSPLLVALVCLLAMAFLGPMKPAGWSTEKKALLCLIDCFLVTTAMFCGITRFIQLLYIVVVAKTAVLLPVRHTALIVLLTSLAQASFSFNQIRQTHSDIPLPTVVGSTLLVSIGSILLMCAVAIVVVALDKERRSRLETERLAQEVESLAKQLERARITREIHDVIGHSLTSLRIQLEVASKYSSLDEAEARVALDQAKTLASGALQEIRHVLRSIRDEQLDLKEAVAGLVKETNSNKSISVHAEVNAESVPSTMALDIYRIVQECLTNAMRHAKADRIDVRIERQNGSVHVHVSDNGKGFDEGINKGIGLAGIEERVQQLGGEVELKNGDLGGATIHAVIPVGEKK